MIETGKKKEEYELFFYTILEKAWHTVRIDWQQFWTEKSPCLSEDLNPAFPDRIPSLFHLCPHHHFVNFLPFFFASRLPANG